MPSSSEESVSAASAESVDSIEDSSTQENSSETESAGAESTKTQSSKTEDKYTLTANVATTYVHELMENHKEYAGYDYLPVAFLAANYDDFSPEEFEKYMTSFGLTKDSLSDDFNKFVDEYSIVLYWMGDYYSGNNDEKKYSYDILVKLEDLVLNPENKEFAKEVDGYFYDYFYANSTRRMNKTLSGLNPKSMNTLERFFFCTAFKLGNDADGNRVKDYWENIFDITFQE